MAATTMAAEASTKMFRNSLSLKVSSSFRKRVQLVPNYRIRDGFIMPKEILSGTEGRMRC